MVFREGVLVFSQPGALPGGALEELIAKVRQLDMEQVHRAAATQAARRRRRRADTASSPSPPDQCRVHMSAVRDERSPLVLGALGRRRPSVAGPGIGSRRVSLEATADHRCARYGRLVGATLGAGT